MRVVVTGATGNVGTALLRALADEPAVDSVVGIARRRPASDAPKTTWVSADIARDDLRPHVAGADVVVHLAWLLQPSRDPLEQWRVNVLGTRRVLDAASDAPALVCASSVGAYSPGPKRPVSEDWPTDGIATSTYSWQKAYTERLLDVHQQAHPDARVVRLRPGLTFQRGAGTQIRRLFLGPFLPRRAVRLERLPLVPDVPGLRTQAVHTDDVAEAYRLAIVRDVSGPFNIAAEPIVDAALLARLSGARLLRAPAALARAALATGWHARLVPVDSGWFDLGVRSPLLDTSRAREELGWTPRHGADDALAELLAGIAAGEGDDTPPLSPATSGPARLREVATGVGRRST